MTIKITFRQEPDCCELHNFGKSARERETEMREMELRTSCAARTLAVDCLLLNFRSRATDRIRCREIRCLVAQYCYCCSQFAVCCVSPLSNFARCVLCVRPFSRETENISKENE